MAEYEEYDENVDWMDREAVKKLTGTYANRIFVQHLGEQMLRLNFGEVLDPDDPTYHTALVLSAANAKLFADLIYRQANAALAAADAETAAAPPIVTVPVAAPQASTPDGD